MGVRGCIKYLKIHGFSHLVNIKYTKLIYRAGSSIGRALI